jgi:hypothetical protein
MGSSFPVGQETLAAISATRDTLGDAEEALSMVLHRSFFPLAALIALASFQPAPCQVGSGIGASVGSFALSDARCKGLPYSAEIVSRTVQTLSDGTHITSEQRRREARDSEGRTRNEIYMSNGRVGARDEDQPAFIFISDPVGGQWIHLNPRQKTAIVNPLPVNHQSGGDASVKTTPQQARLTQFPQARSKARPEVEKLGQDTIDGVAAEGERMTTVIPAGTQGNDRDITVVTEHWRSTDLGIEVLSKTTDPRGDTTTEIKNLSRTEPDPALFQVPPDYKVQAPQPSK